MKVCFLTPASHPREHPPGEGGSRPSQGFIALRQAFSRECTPSAPCVLCLCTALLTVGNTWYECQITCHATNYPSCFAFDITWRKALFTELFPLYPVPLMWNGECSQTIQALQVDTTCGTQQFSSNSKLGFMYGGNTPERQGVGLYCVKTCGGGPTGRWFNPGHIFKDWSISKYGFSLSLHSAFSLFLDSLHFHFEEVQSWTEVNHCASKMGSS